MTQQAPPSSPASPLIGKLCQYRPEHYGKIIFTDWDASNPPYISKNGYALPTQTFQGYLYAPYVPPALNGITTVFSGSWVVPLPGPAPVAPPVLKHTGKENHKAPWKYGMPWTFYDKLPPDHLPDQFHHKVGLGGGNLKDEDVRAKLILTPVEAVRFNVKVKNTSVVIATCEYLRCLMSNPKDENQSVPTTVWVKPDWITPHTGAETYETDLARSLLGKLRAR